MPHRFCAVCGKEIEEDSPHFSLCLNCYLKENELFSVEKDFTIRICINCGKHAKKDTWFDSKASNTYEVLDHAIRQFLLKKYLKKGELDFKISFIESSCSYSSKGNLKAVKAIIEGFFKKKPKIKQTTTIDINIKNDLCKNCSNLMSGSYYVSILQLRVNSEHFLDITDDVMEELMGVIKKYFNKDEKHYVAKIEESKYGYDLYLSTNELMNHIISYLKPKYHFTIKHSKKLVGRDIQKGKNIYRLKTVLRFLPFNRGDRLMINDESYTIENIIKNKVILRNSHGSKETKPFNYFFEEKMHIINLNQEDANK